MILPVYFSSAYDVLIICNLDDFGSSGNFIERFSGKSVYSFPEYSENTIRFFEKFFL